MCIANSSELWCIGFLPHSDTEFPEAQCSSCCSFQVGELSRTMPKTAVEVYRPWMDIRPDSANVERDGEIKVVAPDT